MMGQLSIMAIVEGRGDEKAVPALLRRFLHERMSRYDIRTPKAKFAGGRSGLESRFENFLNYAVKDGCNAILVVPDADKDCPLELATNLSARAAKASLSVPVAVVCAKSEFETWFICTLSDTRGHSLSGRLDVPMPVCVPDNIEDIRDAKGWLQRHMHRGHRYNPAIEQVDLTHHIVFEVVLVKSRSFRRFSHAVEELVQALDAGVTTVTPHLQ